MSTTSEHSSRAGAPDAPSMAGDSQASMGASGRPNEEKGGLLGRRWRKITWAIILWWVAMTILFIAAAVSNHNGCHQLSQAFQMVGGHDNFTTSCTTEADGASVRKALEIGLLGSVPLLIIWYHSRSNTSRQVVRESRYPICPFGSATS